MKIILFFITFTISSVVIFCMIVNLRFVRLIVLLTVHFSSNSIYLFLSKKKEKTYDFFSLSFSEAKRPNTYLSNLRSLKNKVSHNTLITFFQKNIYQHILDNYTVPPTPQVNYFFVTLVKGNLNFI